MATPLAAGVGAPRTPSSGSGKSRRDTQPAGNDRLTDVLLLVSLVACLYAPARSYFAGGAVVPSLLRRDLSGFTIVVTGANTGIGYETARQLAAQNATVVLACRSMDRCRNAVAAITAAHPYVPATRVVAMPLDLADLASVQSFATEVTSRFPTIDVLVNNAGEWRGAHVVWPLRRGRRSCRYCGVATAVADELRWPMSCGVATAASPLRCPGPVHECRHRHAAACAVPLAPTRPQVLPTPPRV